MVFANRIEAGERLSEKLTPYKGTSAIVIGLARGGVVVASTIAKKLTLPLDVASIKKVSPSYDPELALGAVAPDAVTFRDYKLAQRLGIDDQYLQEEILNKSEQVKQKMQLYRKGKGPFSVEGKIVIVVDDGVATGATMEAAVKWLRKKKAKKIVAAIPVATPAVMSALKPEVDELVVLETPHDFSSVGEFYTDFAPVEDTDVIQLLKL